MTHPNAARFGDLSPEEQKKWNERFAREQDNFALGASAMTQAFELPPLDAVLNAAHAYAAACHLAGRDNEGMPRQGSYAIEHAAQAYGRACYEAGVAAVDEILDAAHTIAEWHGGDGDECGTAARALMEKIAAIRALKGTK
jgi:hypothetical protein